MFPKPAIWEGERPFCPPRVTSGKEQPRALALCWALCKKDVSHFTDSGEKSSPVTERGLRGRILLRQFFSLALQNQLGRTENIRRVGTEEDEELC